MNPFQAPMRRSLLGLLGLLGSSLLAMVLVAPAAAQNPGTTQVQFQTTLGPFVLELYPQKAPKTVQNFVQYVKDKHYDGTVFHRVIDGFMVQGGGFTAELAQKPTRTPVPLEIDRSLKNERGTIAMARTGNPNSATSQFFINLVDNPMLNAPQPDGYGYAVFGKVISGMEIVDAIEKVATGRSGMNEDVPKEDVVIEKAVLKA